VSYIQYHGKVVKNISDSKPEGRRKVRPRMRWLEHVEKDALEMEAKRWRQKAVKRED